MAMLRGTEIILLQPLRSDPPVSPRVLPLAPPVRVQTPLLPVQPTRAAQTGDSCAGLANLLECGQRLLARLEMPGGVQVVGQLLARIKSARFRVLVVGDGNRGKTTLINALLRQAILPVFPTPCTGVVTEVTWGQA